jgi:hypothetical protein
MFNITSRSDEDRDEDRDEDNDVFQQKAVSVIIKSSPQEMTDKGIPPANGKMKMSSLLRE